MSRVSQETIGVILGSAVVIQSSLIFGLIISLKQQTRETRKYVDISTYYTTILERENIELTPYDLIALATMYGER